MPYDCKLNYKCFQKIDESAPKQKFLPEGPPLTPNTVKMKGSKMGKS